MRRYKNSLRAFTILLAIAIALTSLSIPGTQVDASGAASATKDEAARMYARPAPNFDLNLSKNARGLRQATADQLGAAEGLKASTGASNMIVRWNDFGGSPDVMMDFASHAYTGTPEEAGRAFLSENAAVFGISNVSDLRLVSDREALGGHLLRFRQTFNGIDVKDGGIGLVMNANKQVIMASGPYFRDVNVNTTPTLSADDARARAAADLARFQVSIPSHIANLLKSGLDNLAKQTAIVQQLEPKLGIYPTADGYKLVWKVAKYSTNPFGLYLISVDAHTGETIARKDYVNFQQAPDALPMTADVYPKYPTITDELKNQGKISVGADGTPLGQERVKLRSFDASNVVTGINGTLTGTHALVNNALASKLPFAQAAKGTWHFRIDDPTNFEARTNEIDHVGPAAEPAEHQDEINSFFFVTYLLEYVDYLHVGGDKGGFGQGSFPDDYPNKTIPLPATVHIPNIYMALDIADGKTPSPTDPDLALKVLGLDNAFALNLTSLIEELSGSKSPVVVNPTSYGHGYLLNDLALEGTVPYHEGMHAITSPIAGLEGDPEGNAMNEGQADMWAFTITDNPSLGDYVVNAHKYRQRFRDTGRDPDSIAYIRSARSTLKFSDIGTLNNGGVYAFEEHYDGEIYMSTMWDVREMMNRIYPNKTTYKRPQPKDGVAAKEIAQGTDIFERVFLGSMYVLGTTAPDTFVKARDAMLVADQMLYSSNTADPAAPGRHRALIEQIFAAHELGVNAREVTGGAATISTQVTPFVGEQAAPSAPQNVAVAPASSKTNRISWSPVQGATAYEVLKRKVAFRNQREPNGKRAYNDGDAATTGFRHIAYVDGSATSYEDRGAVHEVFAPEGLTNLFDSEYVVRAISATPNAQLGISALSGAAQPMTARQNVTGQIDSAMSNVTFSGGVFGFDNTITNARGANSTDKTIYAPIEFRIVAISDPTVTVKNADQNGTAFIYNKTLALGASAVKRIEFNDPGARMFTFEAEIMGQAYAGSIGGTGSQAGDGTSDPPAPITYSVFSEEMTGTLVGGDPSGTSGTSLTHGNPTFAGITYMDVPVTTKGDALMLDATLSSTTAVDLDFDLLTADGQLITSSAGATAAEHVSSQVTPNTRYILRVKGFANGPAEFKIVSRQYLPQGSANENAGTITPGAGGSTGGSSPLPVLTNVKVRFTVNPLLKRVTVQIIK